MGLSDDWTPAEHGSGSFLETYFSKSKVQPPGGTKKMAEPIFDPMTDAHTAPVLNNPRRLHSLPVQSAPRPEEHPLYGRLRQGLDENEELS
jgi:hypothetical protein